MSDVGGERRVVITGAAGRVGHALLRLLDDRFVVTGVDRRRTSRPVPGRPVRRADLRRPRAARRAVRDADVVVHLAVGAPPGTWRDVHGVNVRLTWNVLEAAAASGVRRVVLASSNHVVGGYEHEDPYRAILAGDRAGLDPDAVPHITADAPIRPDGAYAVGKAMDEAAGRFFADERGLSVIALRIGTVRPDDRVSEPRHLATFLTHRDLADLVTRCIDAPESLQFGVFYGVSANTWRIWDIEPARHVLGYAPRDDAETLRRDGET